MTWLTWRQFRAQTWVTLAALAAFGIVLAVSGVELARMYADSGLPGCHGHGGCDAALATFRNQAGSGLTGWLADFGRDLMDVMPALIGAFWGAPLIARELETGTYRLAWNQSITRGRWVAVKLGLVGAASTVTAGLLSLMVTWWAGPLDRAGHNRLVPQNFTVRGIAPIGYAAFAFALGVAIGLLIRRTVPAMAVTLALFAGVQVLMPIAIRPHLITPVRAVVPLDTTRLTEFTMTMPDARMTVLAQADKPGAWVLSNQTVTTAGKVFTGPANTQACGRDIGPKTCVEWVRSLDLRQVLTYQPADRFWAFQWYETGLFLAVALLLAGFCVWWVRRRLT